MERVNWCEIKSNAFKFDSFCTHLNIMFLLCLIRERCTHYTQQSSSLLFVKQFFGFRSILGTLRFNLCRKITSKLYGHFLCKHSEFNCLANTNNGARSRTIAECSSESCNAKSDSISQIIFKYIIKSLIDCQLLGVHKLYFFCCTFYNTIDFLCVCRRQKRQLSFGTCLI